MITVTVTSDSSVPELRVAERTLADLIKLAIGKDMEKPTLNEIAEHFKVPPVPSRKTDLTVKLDAIKEIENVRDEIRKDLDDHYINGTSPIKDPVGIFNATELAEAETLGKPVCSTVDASQSTTAHANTQVNTSLPEPTSVFGQPAQTTVNVAKPVAPTTDNLAIDVNGFPWDSRIHSSSKEMVKDGTWRKRRGVDAAMVAQVEAELRRAPLPEAELNQPKFVELPSTLQPVTHVDVTPTVGTMSFTELLDGVTKAMVAGQLSQAKITEALAAVGLTALPNLLGNPTLIPAFREALGGVV